MNFVFYFLILNLCLCSAGSCALNQIFANTSIQTKSTAIEFGGRGQTEDNPNLKVKTKKDSPSKPLQSINPIHFNDLFGPLLNLDNQILYNSDRLLDNSEKLNNSVWVLFQKNCKSCHQMMEEAFKCLKKNKNLKINFIGVLSKKEALLKLVRDYKVQNLAWYSEDNLVQKLNLQVTPTVFMFQKNKLVNRIENSMSCQEIKKALIQI